MKIILLAVGLMLAPSGPAVSLPAEVKAKPGRLVRLEAQTDGKLVRWAMASEDADLIPFPDGRVAIFSAERPGRYLVLAWTAAGDVPSEAARCVVVVGEPAPPPGPPQPPAPADPLAEALQSAYVRENPADRGSLAGMLASVYRSGAADAASAPTWGALFDGMAHKAAGLGVNGRLMAVQTAVREELARLALPTDRDATLDAAGRALASQAFTRVAVALEGLK